VNKEKAPRPVKDRGFPFYEKPYTYQSVPNREMTFCAVERHKCKRLAGPMRVIYLNLCGDFCQLRRLYPFFSYFLGVFRYFMPNLYSESVLKSI
jgi:hypothetical protein